MKILTAFVLFLALLTTALWVNITISSIINSRLGAFDKERSILVSKTKNTLVACFSLFWAIYSVLL